MVLIMEEIADVGTVIPLRVVNARVGNCNCLFGNNLPRTKREFSIAISIVSPQEVLVIVIITAIVVFILARKRKR